MALRMVKAASQMEPLMTWAVFVFHDTVATIIDAFDSNLADGLYSPSSVLKMWSLFSCEHLNSWRHHEISNQVNRGVKLSMRKTC